MRNIAVLGSTGYIGTQTLEIVRENKDFNVVSMAADSNIVALEQQIREFCPKIVCVYQEKAAADLKIALADTDVKVVSGMDGLIEVATFQSVDIVVTAFVGMVGIKPTLEAIQAGKDIALANKETLVAAGHLVMQKAKENGIKILPVDSEHSAIFQCLNGENKREVEKILLTASGGPFRKCTKEQMRYIKLEDALKHPNWVMGPKITIDSSTMVNKGLEVMEAKWLFNVDLSDIEIIVQPQSLIHSMVQFRDGGIMAQLGSPDMKLPIQYALYYPQRRFLSGERIDFAKISQITFEKPDLNVFKGLGLALTAAKTGGSMPTVFNAANEKAVSLFLKNKIQYLQIADIIEYCMEHHQVMDHPTLEQILEIEQSTYELIDGRW